MLVYTEKEDGTTNIAPVSFFQIPEDVRTAFLWLDDRCRPATIRCIRAKWIRYTVRAFAIFPYGYPDEERKRWMFRAK